MSFQSRVLEQVVRLVGVKRRLARVGAVADDSEKLAKLVKSLRRPDLIDPPRRIARAWQQERLDIDGAPLHVLTKPDRPSRRVILYLHGGGYMFGPALFEWLTAGSIAESSGCDLAMFIYPKAPENQAPQVAATTMRAFDVVAERYGAENVVLVGTSAGGGLAVVVLAELRDRGSPQASLAVLISPGVDIALEHDVSHLEKSDVLLSADFARGVGKLYPGDLGVRHPRVSPTFGNLAGLAPMHVFAGTKEILFPGLGRFVQRVEEGGGEAHLIVGEGRQHTWPTAPTPEGRRALRQIVEIIRTSDPAG